MLPSSTFSAWNGRRIRLVRAHQPCGRDGTGVLAGRFHMQLVAQQREGAGDDLESFESITREITFLLTI